MGLKEYQGASDAMLQAKLASTVAELAQIKNDLDAYQLESIENDWDVESEEWVKMRSRKRVLGIVHQELLREISERKKIGAKRQGMSFASRFVNAAKTRLDKKTYSAIYAAAIGKGGDIEQEASQ